MHMNYNKQAIIAHILGKNIISIASYISPDSYSKVSTKSHLFVLGMITRS